MMPITSRSIQGAPWGQHLVRVISAAIKAVEPGAAVARYMRREGNRLILGNQIYELEHFKRILVVGGGKAGAPMAQATANILGDHLTSGIVVVKDGHSHMSGTPQSPTIQLLEASHPVPDERGVDAAQRMAELLSNTSLDDLIICLISGGGSALMVSPVPGVSLLDLQSLTAALLACGATINEINALRKHLDLVKGGGLARLAAPAKLVTLILSDVVGDPLDVIASGPTVADSSTFSDAIQVLDRYKISDQVPPAIITHLRRGMNRELRETPKPGDPLFRSVDNLIIGSNQVAANAALHAAETEGLQTQLLTTCMQGEARHAGRFLAAIARQIAKTGQPLARPACLVAGGETTVTLTGAGLGGRNQELALSAVADLAGLTNFALVTLATDGGDGPTDAAGAIVTGQTLEQARQVGMDPRDYLLRNDSYHFFASLRDLIKTGPTQTNVNDLNFIFAF